MRTNLFFVLFVVTASTACSQDEVIDPTFDNVYQQVLAPRCTFSACHAAPTKAAQLDLTKEVACRELVNKPSCLFPNRMRIIPGHPEESFFFHKLTGEGLSDVPTSNCSGETNALMPFGGSELPEAEMQLVNAWIAAGASCDPGMEQPVQPTPVGPSPISELRSSRMTPLAGEAIAITITLEKPAMSGGQTIQIETMTPSVFAPESVFVEGGATVARFDAYAGRPTSRFALRATTGTSTKELVLRVGGLNVAEVLGNPTGDDDNLQWIKLRNQTNVTIDLSRYRLRVGQASYDYSTVQLAGSIPAGGCMVIGGPASTYANGEPVFGQTVDFSPNLPTTGPQARGYAVFDDDARPLGEVLTPVDTMLVGANNDAKLLGPDGEIASPFCNDAPEGSTVKRTGAGTCVISEMRPNQCP